MKTQLKNSQLKSVTKIVLKKSTIYFKEPLTFVTTTNSVHKTFLFQNESSGQFTNLKSIYFKLLHTITFIFTGICCK